jgi:hypothetical protein
MAVDPEPTAIAVLHPVGDYPDAQLALAVHVYECLDRGVLILIESPWKR